MKIDTYIQSGDSIRVVYRSVKLDSFNGRVMQICDGVPGERELIIERENEVACDYGAIGVRETEAVFSVLRGDAWVMVPSLLTRSEAEEKARRNEANQRKRIVRDVPLFADQYEPTAVAVDSWIERERISGEEQLERDHVQAIKATSLRTDVQNLVAEEEFSELCSSRERFPKDGSYGIYFWTKQLRHIEETGKPDIFRPAVTLSDKLSFPWLKVDATVTWKTAPGGAQRVRVLFIGSSSISVKLTGEPITDYDPRLIPNQVNWIRPEDVLEMSQADSAT